MGVDCARERVGKRRKKRKPIFEGRMARDCGKRAGNEARK